MATITAVINTYNEEKNIEQCLESLKWCHEIIVVDMNSDDETRTIARRYTEKIFLFPRVGYVEPARKFAVEKAAGDWILLIDADELVPRYLSKKLLDISSTNSADVVYIPFKTYLLGEWIKHTAWWPEHHPRFFKNGALKFQDTIHSGPILEADSNKYYLPATEENAIVHFSCLGSGHFVDKVNKYTVFEAENMVSKGKKFSCFFMLFEGVREFYFRYFRHRGFLDGHRGLFLSLMMAFYRILSYIKLWELAEYHGPSCVDRYNIIKKTILKTYSEIEK